MLDRSAGASPNFWARFSMSDGNVTCGFWVIGAVISRARSHAASGRDWFGNGTFTRDVDRKIAAALIVGKHYRIKTRDFEPGKSAENPARL